jgi:cellulose synthase/poly-beta-1,6-N-acetylglucosamine synthase-like glycosyltransferase
MLALLAALDHLVFLLALLLHITLSGSLVWIVVQHLRLRRAGLADEVRLLAEPLPEEASLPHVLVQIPSFNEGRLAARAAAAAGALDWPRDRLHLQLLDDSTDGSEAVAEEAAATLHRQGIDAVMLHRRERSGYKAGALAEGLRRTDHPFIAVFDADYLPRADFLRLAMRPLLRDRHLALVQARIDYVNGGASAATRVQQRILDAHFGIEQATRSWTGQIMPFNGTCGIWRRAAIDAAGGWQGDTLAEDLDLSYRVQLRGWRALFLVGVAVPGELPPDVATWRTQQFRWTKGFAEVSRKLLPAVWRSDRPLGVKCVSTLHLGASAFGPAVGIAVVTGVVDILDGTGLTPLSATLLAWAVLQGLGVLMTMMLLGQKLVRGTPMREEVKRFPEGIALFLYGAVSNLGGVVEAFAGRATGFVRTPKAGAQPRPGPAPAAPARPDG